MAYVVGLMSGTSLDGVDAVLAEIDASRFACIAHHYRPFAASMREELLALQTPGPNELDRAALLGQRLATEYAAASHELLEKVSRGGTAYSVQAIGCHGQTIRHAPASGYTIQLNNPALLAELTGLTVVADFRSRDIAARGQGAPLVPAFHDALFRVADQHRVIVNLGGIANLTDLPPGQDTRGFDCGPGNMLMDAWIQRHQGTDYDRNGAWAASGTVLPALLDRLLRHPFLGLPPPKSCGREEFNLAWLDSLLVGNEAAADVQATLLELTVTALCEAIDRDCGHPDEVFVCGGGARNGHLMQRLAQRYPQRRTATTELLGLPVDQVEAAAFAWLAWRTMNNEPGNLPAVTGARGPRVLGAIYPA